MDSRLAPDFAVTVHGLILKKVGCLNPGRRLTRRGLTWESQIPMERGPGTLLPAIRFSWAAGPAALKHALHVDLGEVHVGLSIGELLPAWGICLYYRSACGRVNHGFHRFPAISWQY